MAKKKKKSDVEIQAMFGTRADRAMLVVAQPDPDYDWLGDAPAPAVPSAGTLLLQLQGDTARFKERVAWSLMNVWQSRSGAAYFSTMSGEVVTHEDGSFRAEQVVGSDDALELIWGASGKTAKDDVVVVTTGYSTKLMIRRARKWAACKVPEGVNIFNTLAGRSASEFYATTDAGLVLFKDGKAELLDGPDEELVGLCIAANGDLYATGEKKMYVWSEAKQKWTTFKAPAELGVGIAEYDGKVVLATNKGVLCWDGASFAFVVNKFPCNDLVTIGKDLFALGTDGGIYRASSGAWSKLSLPISLADGPN